MKKVPTVPTFISQPLNIVFHNTDVDLVKTSRKLGTPTRALAKILLHPHKN